MIRFLDLLISFLGLFLLSPLLAIVSLIILIDSGLPVFFRQNRVGKNNCDFRLYKFRTMIAEGEQNTFLSKGKSRITRTGRFLRKSKIDELPQLLNVLKGDMSIVGPRPELRKYVELYSNEQKEILSIKPGMTDYATMKFINEEELLAKSENPEELYINKILAEKILLNKLYLHNISVKEYFKIILLTFYSILSQGKGEIKP
jgi:lipopolysaccharide/colanic/teichoic acid biosynthesis glycosyltransferase